MLENKNERQDLYKYLDIAADIKIRRLIWLEHFIIMSSSKLMKQVLDGKPGGRRYAERPNMRWTENV